MSSVSCLNKISAKLDYVGECLSLLTTRGNANPRWYCSTVEGTGKYELHDVASTILEKAYSGGVSHYHDLTLALSST